ncbi:hypothetical protein L1887_34519 [Cichorium endivia]|nr:hypothetical protein L1887_34519 [Cichorium endivia]
MLEWNSIQRCRYKFGENGIASRHPKNRTERPRKMAGDESRTLEVTPTWAVATVTFSLIAVSILIEHTLHLLAKYFNKKRRKSLIKALDQIKSEMMRLGFLSLLLIVCEERIANICIPKGSGKNFLPCEHHESDAEEATKCADQGKISLISRNGVQQLQFLISILAISHVISCILTFSLGMLKMRNWEAWEEITRTLEYKYSNDPRRFQFVHQTSFGKRHLKFWSGLRLFRLPASFLRQFYGSVSKVDYFILRHGFLTAHFDEGTTFDFQKYLRKALEKDFGVVVGVSPWIWVFSVLFIFLSADEFKYSYWLPLMPLVVLLVVGTKLQGIVTKLCLDRNDKSLVVKGTLVVRPSNHFFWFGTPKLLLHLIHFTLVQNSFQLAFFAWTWHKFGLRSCFHRETWGIVIRIGSGVVVQLLCGYVTLPLYALVTQMGTSMRKAHVFPQEVIRGLERWQKKAKTNIAQRNNTSVKSSTSIGSSSSMTFYGEFDEITVDEDDDDDGSMESQHDGFHIGHRSE